MKITLDTNVLLRLVTANDASQTAAAAKAIRGADVVAIGLASLCELAWVLRSRYAAGSSDIARSIKLLTSTGNVVSDRLAVEAGLRVFEAGGDFADGVIAYDGRRVGGGTFVSFDRKAVKLLLNEGLSAELLGKKLPPQTPAAPPSLRGSCPASMRPSGRRTSAPACPKPSM